MLLILTLCFMILFGIGFLQLCLFALREHGDAVKYRYLMAALANQPSRPSVPGWNITYKVKGKATTTFVPGATEAEALRDFVKTTGAAFTSIISSVKA